jgi:hypothetical protein
MSTPVLPDTFLLQPRVYFENPAPYLKKQTKVQKTKVMRNISIFIFHNRIKTSNFKADSSVLY